MVGLNPLSSGGGGGGGGGEWFLKDLFFFAFFPVMPTWRGMVKCNPSLNHLPHSRFISA